MTSPTVYVTVNGKKVSVPVGSTLANLVELVGVEYPTFVVHMDGKPLSGNDWETIPVREGMVVDVIPVVTGG